MLEGNTQAPDVLLLYPVQIEQLEQKKLKKQQSVSLLEGEGGERGRGKCERGRQRGRERDGGERGKEIGNMCLYDNSTPSHGIVF